MASTVKERIRKFREDRVIAIQNGDIPGGNISFSLASGPKLILHIIPLCSFASYFERDLLVIKRLQNNNQFSAHFAPLGRREHGYTQSASLDGFLTYSHGTSEMRHAYTLFYREGIVEAAVTCLGTDKTISAGNIEKNLLEQGYLAVLKNLDIPTPVYIFLSLIDTQGCSLTNNQAFYNGLPASPAYNKNHILLRETVFESFEKAPEELFKPLFDQLWNAWGYDRCFHYDKHGKYKNANS